MKYSTATTLAILSTTASNAYGAVCTKYASKIKIQSTTGEPLSMREVRVYSGSVNVAIGKTATQSSDLNESSGASKAVDGKWRTVASTNTTDCPMWWEVDLGESTAINKVVAVNPGKSCDLSWATYSLLNGDGEYTATKAVGSSCGKGWVVRKFEFDCPTPSPTVQPTSPPTNGVSCGGTLTALNCASCSSSDDANCAGDCGWGVDTQTCVSVDTTVDCGGHRAATCGGCVGSVGKNWCNGECGWAIDTETCYDKDDTVVCGNHRATNCGGCVGTAGEGWCNGVCQWQAPSCVPQ